MLHWFQADFHLALASAKIPRHSVAWDKFRVHFQFLMVARELFFIPFRIPDIPPKSSSPKLAAWKAAVPGMLFAMEIQVRTDI
jgi:hypothetical protein